MKKLYKSLFIIFCNLNLLNAKANILQNLLHSPVIILAYLIDQNLRLAFNYTQIKVINNFIALKYNTLKNNLILIP